jgi:Protein of unknown function (DUF4242)
MPLFMDIHTMQGAVRLADAANAHAADLQTQQKYGVHYLRYWVDEDNGNCSAWWTHRTKRSLRPSTVRHTAWWPTRSTRCKRGPNRR